MTRLQLVGVKKGFLLVWGGIHIEITRQEWDELVAQAMKIEEERKR